MLPGYLKNRFDLQEVVLFVPIALIIIAITYAPNLKTIDTNSVRYLLLSLFNGVTFLALYLFKNKIDFSHYNLRDSTIWHLYTAYVLVVFLSITQSVNTYESIFQFFKILTVYATSVIISLIVLRNNNFIKLISIISIILIIIDSSYVIFSIYEFINKKIVDIESIKGFYSNKNILSAAIFIKIPFVLWFLIYEKSRISIVAWFSLLLGILAILFLATRTFYLGIVISSVLIISYLIYTYYNLKNKKYLKFVFNYISILFISALSFTIVQQNLYPKDLDSRFTEGITTQFQSIVENGNTIVSRFRAWSWSADMLKEKPLLGVGTGNWKIEALRFENKTSTDFQYMYKAHNDFIETFAETGIIGGILFLSLFLLTIIYFVGKLIKSQELHDTILKGLFLSSFGLVFYAIDASLNFPSDRPEIQLYFSIYMAFSIATSVHLKKIKVIDNSINFSVNSSKNSNYYNFTRHLIALFIFLLLLFSTLIFYWNFKSSQLQRIVYENLLTSYHKVESDLLISGFPQIPNLTSWSESINTIKARYLINEQEYDQVINLLKDDHTNPYDSRREHYLATSYLKLGEVDTALYYAEKAYNIKPNLIENVKLFVEMLDASKKTNISFNKVESYLENNKNNEEARIFAANYYFKKGIIDRSYEINNESLIIFPNNIQVNQLRHLLYLKKYSPSYKADYNNALSLYSEKKFKDAVRAFINYLIILPEDKNAHYMLMLSNLYSHNYLAAIEGANYMISIYEPPAEYLNYRGLAFIGLGDANSACNDFKESMTLGNLDASTNYEFHCASLK